MLAAQRPAAIGHSVTTESQHDHSVHSQDDKGKAEAQIDAYVSGSNSRATDTAGIQRRTLECQALFESCQRNPHLSGDDWIDKMSAEFNWWSLGIGAAKGGHSSLDYRVQTRDDVRNVLVNLLDSLATSIAKYIDAASKSCSLSTSTTTPAYDKDLQGSAAHGSESQASEDGSMIDEQKYYIETTIRFLSQISMAIRKSGTKFRHQRVDKLLTARELELKEFRDYIRHFLLMSPTKVHTLHGILHQYSVTGDPTWKILWITLKAYFTDIRRLTPVQSRLIQANLVRRNRFDLYLARYHRKMRVQKGQQLPRTQATTVATMRPQEPQAPAPSQSRVLQPSSKQDDTIPFQPSRTEGSQRSSQSATKIGSFVMPQRTQQQKARSVSTKLSQGVLKQDYPKCPGAEGESFWCPYCAQLLDSSYSDSKKNKRWRGHVVEDLSPYVCLYEDCDSPDAMYVTTLEWKKHIRERHSRAQWICDPCWLDSECPEEFEFESQVEWRRHTQTAHEDEVEEDDLPDLAELSQRTGVPPIACPLCYEDVSLRNPETDKHLTEHLHSFALQALPWEATGYDDETQVSMGSDIAKSNHSVDSEQSTPEKHQEYNHEINPFDSILAISRSSFLDRLGRAPSSLEDLLKEMSIYLGEGELTARLAESNPSIRSEISSCLARLNRTMQRGEDKSFDLLDPTSIDNMEQDLTEGLRSLQHVARLSLVDSLQTLSFDDGVSELPDGPRSEKARDPENWDIETSDGGSADAPTVQRILPYERNSEFIARPGLFEKIFSMIPTSSRGSRNGALWGVGGSGKTQLALEYAYTRCGDPNCSIFWVRADSAATFTEDYRLIAKDLEIEQHLKGDDLLAAVCTSIEAHQPWVLILDGADDLSLFSRKEDSEYFNTLLDFVPKGPRGTVLWTTRDESLGRLVSKPCFCFNVSGMKYVEAWQLFKSTRGQMAEHQDTADMRHERDHLLDELQYLPLAIMQAGSYMRHTDTSIREYTTLLVENKQHSRFVVSKWNYGVVLFTSAISLDWIRQHNRDAYEMLHVLAHLDNRNITLDFLSELIRNTAGATNMEDSQRLPRAIEELTTLNLISPAGSGWPSFEMHQLVQDAVRDCQDDTGPASWSIFLAKALSLVISRFSVSHAVSVCKRAETGGREGEATALLRKVSRLLDDEERWLEKESVDKRVLALQERVLGESHPETISTAMSLAATFFQQGRSDKAMELATRALEVRQRTWGEKNSYTMKSKVAVGMIFHQQGLYHEAEAIYSEVLNLQIQESGLGMETRSYILDCLAWNHYAQGRYEEAEAHLNIAWSWHQEFDGGQHPDTLQALHQLAVIVHMNGHPEKGIELMQTCVESRREVLGFAHPLTNVSTLLLEEWKAEERFATY
ncbi:NB-ARC domain-containing protein [Fusarium sp. LHS14.1]|nr:NB-ARC domain-containing protein [Fusarium sp. LHS14.1]